MFKYAFFLDGFNHNIVKTALITKRIITPSNGLKLYALVGDVAKYYTEAKKEYFRFWGIGVIIENVNEIEGLRGVKYENNWGTFQNFRFFHVPGDTTLDFSNAPEHTIFALAPTISELKQLVYRNPKEDYPSWYWKGIACDWLYTPTDEEFNQSTPLFETEDDPDIIVHRIGIAKTDEYIEKYLSTKAVKTSHFSHLNKIEYSEPTVANPLF